MKNVVSAFFDQLEKDVLERLCAEVKETVATGLVYPETKVKSNSFGIVDLWGMRRNIRTASGRLNNRHRDNFIRGGVN